MADKCARCGSADTQALANRYQCLTCGGLTDYTGKAVAVGADESTHKAVARALEPRR